MPPPLTSIDPRTGAPGPERFAQAAQADIDRAVAGAEAAFHDAAIAPGRRRANALRGIAESLGESRETIVATADFETGLGPARLHGELDRTVGQLRMFADLVDEGSFVEAVISTGDPQAHPPRPDVRRMLVPLGPIAVFTPSNFPLAFGVAGGDTAAALAAGCPVVVKGHPSHPATSDLCARLVATALAAASAPTGAFSLLQSRDPAVSAALVTAPPIKAVAFTGSLAAGRAIYDLAAARPEPVPVFAEMGSLNPMFIGPAALKRRAEAIVEGLSASIAQGTGQFCTKPGLVVITDDEEGRAFAARLARALEQRGSGVMLNASLAESLDRQLAGSLSLSSVVRLTTRSDDAGCVRGPVLLAIDAATWLATPALQVEHFGPCSIVVFCDPDRMAALAKGLRGTLTATIHADEEDHDWAAPLAAVVSARAGRLVWNAYPTGVAVVPAMQHGGPYPASTTAAHTSVGAMAIRRFMRPVAWQNAPDNLLPAALRDGNPLGIQRMLEGVWGGGKGGEVPRADDG